MQRRSLAIADLLNTEKSVGLPPQPALLSASGPLPQTQHLEDPSICLLDIRPQLSRLSAFLSGNDPINAPSSIQENLHSVLEYLEARQGLPSSRALITIPPTPHTPDSMLVKQLTNVKINRITTLQVLYE